MFKEKGLTKFLRFIDVEEKSLDHLQSEIELLKVLSSQNLEVAMPVLSIEGQYNEKIH